MKVIDTICAGILLLASTLASTVTAQQIPGEAATVRTIDVGTARPVLRAIEALRERYHVPITYEEPRYVYAQDLQDISYVHKGPVPRGVNLVAPRAGTIHFQYAEVNGKPQEDITSLIRRLLTEYAAQGGPVFDVRERATPKGTQWNVIPVKARDTSGYFVDQPDILGAPIYIAEAFPLLEAPVIVYGTGEVISALREFVFNDHIWPNFEKLQLNNGSGPALEFRELQPRSTVSIEGIDVTPIPVNHIVPTVGLLVQNEAAAVLFTSDTYSTDEIWETARDTNDLKAVFVDVSYPNELGELAAASKHLTPELLALELEKLRREVEVYAIHIKPMNRDDVIKQVAALDDPRVSIGEIDRLYEW